MTRSPRLSVSVLFVALLSLLLPGTASASDVGYHQWDNSDRAFTFTAKDSAWYCQYGPCRELVLAQSGYTVHWFLQDLSSSDSPYRYWKLTLRLKGSTHRDSCRSPFYDCTSNLVRMAVRANSDAVSSRWITADRSFDARCSDVDVGLSGGAGPASASLTVGTYRWCSGGAKLDSTAVGGSSRPAGGAQFALSRAQNAERAEMVYIVKMPRSRPVPSFAFTASWPRDVVTRDSSGRATGVRQERRAHTCTIRPTTTASSASSTARAFC